jgi:hypothetical protein
MRQIIRDMLWIGNAFEARDAKLVLDNGIAAIVDLAIEELPDVLPREMIYCRFPMIDGQGNSPAIIEGAIKTAVTFVTGQISTLISCSDGMSRSLAITAAVVAVIEHIPPETALKQIAASGPHDVTPLFWQEVTEGLHQIIGPPAPTDGAKS